MPCDDADGADALGVSVPLVADRCPSVTITKMSYLTNDYRRRQRRLFPSCFCAVQPEIPLQVE